MNQFVQDYTNCRRVVEGSIFTSALGFILVQKMAVYETCEAAFYAKVWRLNNEALSEGDGHTIAVRIIKWGWLLSVKPLRGQASAIADTA